MAGKQNCVAVAFMLASLATDCGSVEQQVLRWMPPPAPDDRHADNLRMDYQQTGSPEAIRALLAHYVEQRMSPGEALSFA